MPLPLKDHIFVDQTVRGWKNPTILQQLASKRAAESWCKNPSDYNFVGDFQSEVDPSRDHDFRFVGSKCASICSTTNTAGSSCLHPPEVWMKEGKNELFLTTALRETTYSSNGTTKSESYLLPFAEDLSIAFKVSFEELDKTILRLGHTARSVTGNVFSSSDFEQPTKFISSCGTVVKEHAPGSDLTLTVDEIFALVCKEGYLDEIQPSAGTNLLKGAKYSEGALGRIVGAEISIKLFINADKKTAHVTATLSPQPFVGGSRSDTIFENGSSALRFRQYNGIRVRFVVDGIQTVFDLNNVILNVSALVVYLSLPIIFIKFFAVYGLGHLSRIYKGVIYSKFNMSAEVGAMATRLMGSSSQFHALEDVIDADHDGVLGDGGISRDVMKAYIKDALQYRGDILDEQEIGQFVEFSFNEVDVDHTHHEPSTFCGNIKAMILDYFDFDATSEVQSRPKSDVDNINMDEFNSAFHSAFPVSFSHVVKLFDKDRKQGILERIFTPEKLKKALTKARNKEATPPRSPRAADASPQIMPAVPPPHKVSDFSEDDALRSTASTTDPKWGWC